jgi:EmrB/QacA subfamily drug resistance transporter
MTSQTAIAPPNETSARHGAITAVVCLALAAVVAAMSSLNVALPNIARSTNASQTSLAWIVDAYALTFAALLLPAGAFGDRYGRRVALLAGLSIFGLGSAAAMFVSSPAALIGLRAVLGLGAALVMPATLSTITSTFPDAERIKAVGVWVGVAGASAIVGAVCSGALLQFFSWPSVFGMNLALAIIAIVAAFVVVPESAAVDAPRLDLGGALVSVAGLFVLVYSIIEAPTAGWSSARTLVGIGIGVALLVAFVRYELLRDEPMLDPRIFTRRGLSAGSIAIFVQFFAFFGLTFLMLQYLQIVRHESALMASISTLPMAVTMMPSARLAPKFADRFGGGRVCVSGLVILGVAFVLLAGLETDTSYWTISVDLLVLGVGAGLTMTPATTSITAALPKAQQGIASAVNDLAREVGGAFGIAVLGSIMTATYRANLDTTGLADGLVARARESVAAAAHLGAPVAGPANSAFVDGMQVAFLAAAAAVALAAVVVASLQRSARAR